MRTDPNPRRLVGFACALALAAAATAASAASPFAPTDLGARASTGDHLDGAAVFARWQASRIESWLPRGGRARWDLTLGWWQGRDDDLALIAFGPVFSHAWPDHDLRLSFGTQPTLLSDYRTDRHDLGGTFQFTSHVALIWTITPRWSFGARVQHTSNADIYSPNPGVDMFVVALDYRR